MPYNFVDDSFTQRNFIADFLQAKCNFKRKTAVFRVLSHPLGLRDKRTMFIMGKRVVEFLLVLTELLSQGVTAEALRTNIGLKSAISLRWPVDPKCQVKGVAPSNHSSCDKTI